MVTLPAAHAIRGEHTSMLMTHVLGLDTTVTATMRPARVTCTSNLAITGTTERRIDNTSTAGGTNRITLDQIRQIYANICERRPN